MPQFVDFPERGRADSEDLAVPLDVPFENYSYFVELMREITKDSTARSRRGGARKEDHR